MEIEQLKRDFATCGWYKNDGMCQRGKEAITFLEQLQAELSNMRRLCREVDCDLVKQNGQLQTENKTKNEYIELLQECDDTSTETIGKMCDEIEQLQAELDSKMADIKHWAAYIEELRLKILSLETQFKEQLKWKEESWLQADQLQAELDSKKQEADVMWEGMNAQIAELKAELKAQKEEVRSWNSVAERLERERQQLKADLKQALKEQSNG